MAEDELEAPVQSPRVAREAAIRRMDLQQLQDYTIALSRNLADAKSLLRVAAKRFRWLQKPTDAQDIDKFLDGLK